MKFCLILTFTVLFLAEAYSRATFQPLTAKCRLRNRLREVVKLFYSRGAEICYTRVLSHRATRNSYREQQECVSAAINVFVNKIDDYDSFEDVAHDFRTNYIGDLVKGVCEVYNDMAECNYYGNPLSPQFQSYCSALNEEIIAKYLTIGVPFIYQTFCLRNDHLNAEIFEDSERPKCHNNLIYNMIEMGFSGNSTVALAASESTDAQNSCNQYLNGLKDKYGDFGACAPSIYAKVKTILGNFCEAAQCSRYFSLVQCDLSL